MKVASIPEDLSKVDIGYDFMRFPLLYSTPEDIEKFIIERKLDCPVLMRFLQLLKGDKLGLTPTEKSFYFDEFFHYVYVVFRVPVPETYKRMSEWLVDYLEGELIQQGLAGVAESAYRSVRQAFDARHQCDLILGRANEDAPINYYTEVQAKYPDYYQGKDTLEEYWIRSSQWAGQPERIGEEAYMRVHVHPKRVYIFGCDDCSYTLLTKTKKDALEFSKYLKHAAPVWNFSYLKLIHPDLEFTN